MAGDRGTRASDADRDQTAAFLRENHVAGRLTADEFSQRLDAALTAKTLGDLDALTADLPAADFRLPAQLPSAAGQPDAVPADWQRQPPVPATHGRLSPAWRASWASWLGISLLSFVVWLLSGAGSPWFLWVVLPLGALLAGRWIMGAPPRSDGHDHGRDRRRHRRYDERW